MSILTTSTSSDKTRVNDPNFMCLSCDVEFLEENLLRKHIQLEHGSKLRFTCEQCDGSFRKEEDLQYHTKTIHLQTLQMGFLQYKHDRCDVDIAKIDNFKKHTEACQSLIKISVHSVSNPFLMVKTWKPTKSQLISQSLFVSLVKNHFQMK